MVSITKWLILGLGLVAASFFFKEAAGSSLTSTLARTGIASKEVGSGIAAIGAGAGEAGVRALDPFFSMADLFKKFGNLFGMGNGETTTSTTLPAIATTGGVSFSETNPQTPSDWFDPLPAAFAETEIISPSSVGGSDIRTSVINWAGGSSATLPLSQEARDYYGSLGVNVSTSGGGGGSNASTGGGGGSSASSAASGGGSTGGFSSSTSGTTGATSSSTSGGGGGGGGSGGFGGGRRFG